ncbi:hypothetical protein [Streptacidiphilus fuscans]|uniref:Lipoprotein n=1 Tax=Streptacidiphilus fuscans TaxID=2789292 RepID=A0A931FE73_9ACTN|nr:hypothetical protein [Streptacidiphilus fuscans]MBF9068870.1 hypothetical protein [Streptacidiphilus fuscans]
MSKQQMRPVVLGIAGMALVCGVATACTSGAATPAPSHTSSATPSATMPAFPTVPQQNLLASASNQAGQKSYTTLTLASRSITIQLGCIGGGGKLAVSAQIYQGSAKPIYQINRQPCEGSVQKVSLTADSTAPLKIDVSSQPGSVFSLLATQG